MDRKQEIRRLCGLEAEKSVKICGFGAWYEMADKVLTPEEKAEVRALWNTLPGYTCWMDAFFRWMNAPSS